MLRLLLLLLRRGLRLRRSAMTENDDIADVQCWAFFQASPPMESCLQVVTVTPPSLVPERMEE